MSPSLRSRAKWATGLTLTGFDIVSLNNYEDSIWQVIIDVDAKVKNCICKRIEVKPGPSKHRMAHNIRDLGFANAKPFIIMSTDNCRAKLNAGRPICSWKTPPIPYKHEDEIAFEKEVIKRSI